MAIFTRRAVAPAAALLLSCVVGPAFAAEPVQLAASDSAAGSKPGAASAPAAAAEVPLARVILLSSGVGFFDRQGEVAGNASLAIKFNASDINDLLKSLVVEDRGGQIAAVTYDAKDPIAKTLSKFAINLTSNPTLGQILNQIRGERIEFSASGPMAGTLLGVETRKRQLEAGTPPVDVEILNVLSDDGLRSVPLDQVGTIKLTNPQLDKEFRQALAVLATAHDAEKKSVTLRFTGQGQRPVRVGYIQNMPIWKTSYRLVLSDDGKPQLQGWAIVENTTEEDWHNVQLTLVSGRPVSFVMNLYDPLYVQRPLVQPDLFAGLMPQVHRQDLTNQTRAGKEHAEGVFTPDFKSDLQIPLAQGSQALPVAMAPGAPGVGRMGGMGSGVANHFGAVQLGEVNAPAYFFNPSAMTAANTADVGEQFQYRIGPPVSLNRQESAMLPIVDGEVSGSKLSVYNPAVQIKHPLCGLRLKNSTDLHLMQGPITVFDGGAYAGDARIEDIAPGGERLVTYALDLDVEVAPAKTDAVADEISDIRLLKGVLYSQRKQVRPRGYTLKNSDTKDKTVLVEQPLEQGWKLIKPEQATETTAELYRFEVKVPAGKSAELEIVEERTLNETASISNIDDPSIQFFRSQRAISPQVKAALEQIVEMKAHIERLVAQRQDQEKQLGTIGEEQNRIRQNMQQLDRNSDLYKRYVRKFGDQEDAVERLRKQIDQSTQEETQQRKNLDNHLMSLDLK